MEKAFFDTFDYKTSRKSRSKNHGKDRVKDQVKIDCIDSKRLRIDKRVRQGCVWSSMLFIRKIYLRKLWMILKISK